MKTIAIKLLITIATMCLFHGTFAQFQGSYDVKLLRAKFTDPAHSKKDVVAIFLVTVRDTANFPPGLNLPPKVTYFANGKDNLIFFDQENLSLRIFDDRVMIKDVRVYDMIKDKVDLSSDKKIMILVFTLKNFTDEDFTKMKFNFKLTEKHDKSLKIEHPFEFDVEK